MSLFTDKYCPLSTDKIIGNKIAIKEIFSWINLYKQKDKSIKRGLLISGPCGIGKTIVAQLVLKECGYDVIEINNTVQRGQKELNNVLSKFISGNNILQMMGITDSKTAIIMDDIECFKSGDRGGLAEIIQFINPLKGRKSLKKKEKDKLINRWNPPIICIKNNVYNKKLSELEKVCKNVNMYPPNVNEIYDFVKYIITNENINLTDNMINKLITSCNFDIRNILNILHNCCGIDKITIKLFKNIQHKKEIQDINIYQITERLIKLGDNNIDESSRLCDLDKSMLPMMMHENYPFLLSKNDTETAEKILDLVCCGDVIDTYVFNYQKWSLQDIQLYISCISVAILINKNQVYDKRLKFTEILGKISNQGINNKHVSYLRGKININYFISIEDLYYFRRLLVACLLSNEDKNFKKGIDIMNEYNIDIEDIDKLIKIDKVIREEQEKNCLKIKNKLKKYMN